MKKITITNFLIVISFTAWSQAFNEKVTVEDGSDNQLDLIQSSGKSWQFRVGTSGSMIFKDDGVERLRFDQNGNVGIGTTSPNVKLDIAGSGTSTTITRLNSGGHANFRQSRGSSSYDGGYFFLTGSTIDWRFQESANTSDLHIRDESLGSNIMTFQNNTGNVGIGTNDPLSKLAVEGQIRATEVKVLSDISVPDYVFEPDYELRTLKETKEYITENKHLPEIPSASEISENGIDLGNMNMSLLKKIEELTLYQIQLLERLEKAEEKILKLENE